MALYIPHSIFHLARLLHVRPETFRPYYVPTVLMVRKKWCKELPYQSPCNIVCVLAFAQTFNEFIISLRIRNSFTIFTRIHDLLLSVIGWACTPRKLVSCLLDAEKTIVATFWKSD